MTKVPLIPTVAWRDGAVVLLDQRRLPAEEAFIECRTVEEVARSIEDMTVRGAPAIGVTAAFGVALGARALEARDPEVFWDEFEACLRRLSATRPTARNLFWAIERMREVARSHDPSAPPEVAKALEDEALAILEEDVAACRAIGKAGSTLVADGATVLTHCNAGGLATAGYGTAGGVIRTAHYEGKSITVFVDETRPFLQGSRLTAWELARDGIPIRLITDNMAGHFLQRGAVDIVVVGADRIAANGDVANKIGTYPLALVAREHEVPFYVAAPTSTVDLTVASGAAIPIEERSADEVTTLAGTRLAPEGIGVANPAFDITPAELITAIITERGIVEPPYDAALKAVCSG
ncbi:S-methyl-5-thioribose-1-phosphate isomerase [Nitrospinae bacterium AH-259-F20]|nr:S-methyl-5-thioribose-1-phosphate isomerase [Nitrospinae bacterium AH-259-F20]